jgi:hypothetical protein
MGKTPCRSLIGIEDGDSEESMRVHMRDLNFLKMNLAGTMRTPSEQKR